jgi:LuxR family maltose regulon positive regulatory protein
MPESLLTTKYHCPAPAPDLVARPQVIGLLEAGLRDRLTLISAPAGFGKTTAVVQWLGEAQRVTRNEPGNQTAMARHERVAWLSLDADDNALPRFWAYIIAALQTVVPGVGRVAQAVLQAPPPFPIEPVLTALVNDLAALTTPLLLVLDDYHLITLPAIHRSVDLLLEHLPPTLRLLIITREDPPLALARLRARGQLAEIRAANLRFSAGEAAIFLNTALALPLSEPDIATLLLRTEGWITGLRLASLSRQHTADQHAFVAAFGASDSVAFVAVPVARCTTVVIVR